MVNLGIGTNSKGNRIDSIGFVLLLYVFFGVGNCASPTEERYYSDLDYFKLKGVSELAWNELEKYPYYGITELGEKRRVRYFPSAKVNYEDIYQKMDSRWVSIYESYEALYHEFTREYICNDRVITFKYWYSYYPQSGDEVEMREMSLDSLKKMDWMSYDHFLHTAILYTEDSTVTYHYPEKNNITFRLMDDPFRELVEINDELDHNTVAARFRRLDADKVEETIVSTFDPGVKSVNYYSLKDDWGRKHNVFWLRFFGIKLE